MQMPSSVESIRADWSEATVRCASSLALSRRPASAVPTPSTTSAPNRTAIRTLSTLTLSASVAITQSPTEIPATARPPSTPRSNPTSATHGANATTPSLLDHDKAIIKPHVPASPASAMNVKRYRRRTANDTANGSVVARLDAEDIAERLGDLG